jgi:hypothetical protein
MRPTRGVAPLRMVNRTARCRTRSHDEERGCRPARGTATAPRRREGSPRRAGADDRLRQHVGHVPARGHGRTSSRVWPFRGRWCANWHCFRHCCLATAKPPQAKCLRGFCLCYGPGPIRTADLTLIRRLPGGAEHRRLSQKPRQDARSADVPLPRCETLPGTLDTHLDTSTCSRVGRTPGIMRRPVTDLACAQKDGEWSRLSGGSLQLARVGIVLNSSTVVSLRRLITAKKTTTCRCRIDSNSLRWKTKHQVFSDCKVHCQALFSPRPQAVA